MSGEDRYYHRLEVFKTRALALLFLCFVGCTTTETDPTRVSFWDLIGPGRSRLDRHLAEEKARVHDQEQSVATIRTLVREQNMQIARLRHDVLSTQARTSSHLRLRRQQLAQIESRQRDIERQYMVLDRLLRVRDSIPTKEQVDRVRELERQIALLRSALTELTTIESERTL